MKVSVPIPTWELEVAKNNEDAELSRQIVELVTRRKALRQSLNVSAGGSQARSKPKVRIISNVQVVPPRGAPKEMGEVETTERMENATSWQVVGNKNAKKGKKKKTSYHDTRAGNDAKSATWT